MSQVDKPPLLPLPVGALSHAVVFFDSMPKNVMTQLTGRLQAEYPHLRPLDPARWGAATEPRMVSFGELVADTGAHGHTARWHLLVDSEGVAPDVQRAILSGPQASDERLVVKLEEANASVLVFLLDDGWRPSTPTTRMRALCDPVWELLTLGASGVAFPEGGTMLSAETLKLISPSDLTAGHSYLFVSSGLAHRGESHFWFRTFGMAQFGLPDLCHAVPVNLGEELEEELTRTRLVLETLPPEMIAQGGVLPIGGSVLVGERAFKAAPMPDDAPPLVSRHGFCYLE
jgi:hypothetical protein